MKQQLQKIRSALIHGYSFPVVLSLVLHGILFAVLVIGWDKHKTLKIAPPVHINAALVELPKTKPAPKPSVDRQVQRKRAAEQKRKQEEAGKKAAARKREQKRQQELALKRKKEAEEKARKKEEARRLAERKQKQEDQRRKQEEARRKKQEMLDRLAREQQQQEMQAAAEAEFEQQQVAQYSALIKSLSSQYWNRPPSARNNMVAEVRIGLSPFGDLLDITLVQGSGNDEFDRSVMQAVKNAAPFPEFKQLDRRIFDKFFRRITIRFRPEDLVR